MKSMIEKRVYISNEAWPHVVLMAGVHGDEPAGVDALTALGAKMDSMPFCGTITCVVANRRAVNANVRFVDTDLNRLFSESEVARINALEPMARNHEESIVIELSEVLQTADYMLDLHSTIQPSIPFLYAENTPKHREILKHFSIETAVLSNAAFQPKSLTSSTDNYVDRMGGVGITLESGWKNEPGQLDFILEQIALFLNATGCTNRKNVQEHAPPVFYTPTAELLLPANGFTPIGPWSNFAPVAVNEPLLQKGGTTIMSPSAGVLLFPKKNLQMGQTGGYIAQIINQ